MRDVHHVSRCSRMVWLSKSTVKIVRSKVFTTFEAQAQAAVSPRSQAACVLANLGFLGSGCDEVAPASFYDSTHIATDDNFNGIDAHVKDSLCYTPKPYTASALPGPKTYDLSSGAGRAVCSRSSSPTGLSNTGCRLWELQGFRGGFGRGLQPGLSSGLL